jgi:S-adenosylmethionine:tRNA ribosyltransferase-isomerase
MGQPGLRTEELEYTLPDELIATRPAVPRDAARLLVVHRDGDRIEHRHIRDLPEYLQSTDRIVFNTTKVVPARLRGRRSDSGGYVGGLYLDETADGHWRMMLRSNGKLRRGHRIDLLDRQDGSTDFGLELLDRDDALWIARRVGTNATMNTLTWLDAVGATPLPPYILHARQVKQTVVDDAHDRAWYQTVFADEAQAGSVAAPTASLHFTDGLLGAIAASGVQRLDITLHVGPGTFKPITTETLADHVMHEEWYRVPEATVDGLVAAQHEAARILAVGTTAVRTLESLPSMDDLAVRAAGGAIEGRTDLMIAPPYDFRYVGALLTNFHLPRSTLLALVAALVGLDRLKAIYAIAVQQRYRFYSYGDAMLIL